MTSINYAVQKLSAAGLTVDVDGDFILCEDPDLNFERSHDGVRGVAGWLRETLDEYEAALEEFMGPSNEELAIELEEDEGPKLWTEEEQRAQADKELLEIAVEEECLANEASPEEPWSYEEAMGHLPGYNPNQSLSDESLEAEEAFYDAKEEPEVYNFVEWILKTLGRTQPAADPPPREHGDLFTGLSPVEFAPAPPEKGHRLDQLALAKELNEARMSPKELWQAQQNASQDRGGIPNPVDYITEMKLGAPAVGIIVKGQTFAAPEGWKIKEVRPLPEAGADVSRVIFYGSIFKGRKLNNALKGSRFSLVRL